MKLTPRTTETLVRRLATASNTELEQCVRDLKTLRLDDGQPTRVRTTSAKLGRLVATLKREL